MDTTAGWGGLPLVILTNLHLEDLVTHSFKFHLRQQLKHKHTRSHIFDSGGTGNAMVVGVLMSGSSVSLEALSLTFTTQ